MNMYMYMHMQPGTVGRYLGGFVCKSMYVGMYVRVEACTLYV